MEESFRCDYCGTDLANILSPEGVEEWRSEISRLRTKNAADLLAQHHVHEAELALYAYTLDSAGLLDGIAKRDPLEWLAGVKRKGWVEPLDEELIVRELSPVKDGETAKEAIHRLMCWEIAVALDPAVSSSAKGLLEKGAAWALRDEATRDMEEWRKRSLINRADAIERGEVKIEVPE